MDCCYYREWLARGRMMGSGNFGNRVGLVGYRVPIWVAVVVKQLACRNLTCWPASGAEMEGGGA